MSVAPWRLVEAAGGRFYDDHGRPVESYSGKYLPAPRRLGMPTFMDAIPGLREQFEVRVPASYVTEDVEDGTHLAEVACPCKETPIVELGSVRECRGCGRFYYYAGAPGSAGRRAVFVANSPAGRRAGPPVD